MKVVELMESQEQYLHLLPVSRAVQVLQTGKFVAKSVNQRGDLAGEADHDLYSMSVARGPNSEFISIMGHSGSVIMVLDGRKLTANYKSSPYDRVGPNGESYRKYNSEEEDRVYSPTPEIAIRGAINQTVLSTHFVDLQKQWSGQSEEQQAAFDSLISLCTQLHIAMMVYPDERSLVRLRGGKPYAA